MPGLIDSVVLLASVQVVCRRGLLEGSGTCISPENTCIHQYWGFSGPSDAMDLFGFMLHVLMFLREDIIPQRRDDCVVAPEVAAGKIATSRTSGFPFSRE